MMDQSNAEEVAPQSWKLAKGCMKVSTGLAGCVRKSNTFSPQRGPDVNTMSGEAGQWQILDGEDWR